MTLKSGMMKMLNIPKWLDINERLNSIFNLDNQTWMCFGDIICIWSKHGDYVFSLQLECFSYPVILCILPTAFALENQF